MTTDKPIAQAYAELRAENARLKGENERLVATVQQAIDYEELTIQEYVNKYENYEEPILAVLRAALSASSEQPEGE